MNLVSKNTLQVFASALLGAFIGVVIAGIIVSYAFPVGGPVTVAPYGMLQWLLQERGMYQLINEPRERGFYLLALLFGGGGAWLAAMRPIAIPVNPLVLLISFVLAGLMNGFIQMSFYYEYPAWGYFLFGVLLICGAIIIYRALPRLEPMPYVLQPSTALPIKAMVAVLLLISVVLFPYSFESAAVSMRFDQHRVFYLFGPALFYRIPGLLPGVDYFTQYGVGIGPLYSFLLGDNTTETIVHYMQFIVAITWVFFVGLFFFLNWLYQNWRASLAVVILTLILQMVSYAPFYAPSTTVLRYLLLLPCAWCLMRWSATPACWRWKIALAFILALSLFMNTETGIFMSIASALVYLASGPVDLKRMRHGVVLAFITLALFFEFVLVAFGPGVMHLAFWREWLEPLILYSAGGFGALPIDWSFAEGRPFYNVIAPGFALATVGYSLMRLRRSEEGVDRHRHAVLAFIALCGLFFIAKYITRSLVAVWHVNAMCFLIVLGWWAMVFLRALGDKRLPSFHGKPGERMASVAGGIMVCACLALGGLASDNNNPEPYGIQAWFLYPSFPQFFVAGEPKKCSSFKCLKPLFLPGDVDLISSRTKPGERVALLDLYDWVYFLDHNRLPMANLLPSSDMFTKKQLTQSLEQIAHAEYVFVPTGKEGVPNVSPPDLAEALQLEKYFSLEAHGERLGAWRRKP